MTRTRRSLALATAGLLAALPLAGCSSSSSGGGAAGSAGDKVKVVASFYPVQFLLEQVGGDRVEVTTLTRPGAEPHDVELTPKDLATVSGSALLVYAKGFQPAVDDAVAKGSPGRVLDLAPAARLDLPATTVPGEHDGHAEDAGHDHAGGLDPHFWLDPTRYAGTARAVAEELGKVDPAHAGTYASNVADLTARLTALDGELSSALASCASRELVTSHAAFGYLAQRYRLTQVPIALNPEGEPSAAKLAEVSTFVKEHGVHTIYSETLVEPRYAQTVARGTGATVATLDPIEGIMATSAAQDYFGLMRANKEALKAGQRC